MILLPLKGVAAIITSQIDFNRMTYFIRHFLRAFFIGVFIFLILRGLDVFFDGFFRLHSNDYLNFLYNQMYAVPLYLVNIYFFKYLGRVIKEERFSSKRVIIGIFGSVLVTMISVFLIRVILYVAIQGYSPETFLQSEQISFYVVSLVATFFITLIFHSFYFYKELQRRKLKEQKVIAGTATAQFDALKNQLDPHFLFNSLNVLTSLIEENPDMAQKFTTSLSKVYRYVLEQKNKDLVSVDEELQFAKTYMGLLKVRFENSIIFEAPEHASNPDAKLVPLSLQLLLENTVKHNKVDPQHPLKIKIYEEQGDLVVENNLQHKETLGRSSGVGLRNIRQRYQILSNRQVQIEKTEDKFTVRLPILTKSFNIMKTTGASDSYIRARKRVDELKEFYTSLVSYIVVIPFLIFINYSVYRGFLWFWFPLIGWGLGLIIQAYKVFGPGFAWEEKKIRQFMEEENQRTKWN